MVWYKKYLSVYDKPFTEAPQSVIDEVKDKISKLQSPEPLATISLIAYNEEKHLLSCLWSLSDTISKYPIEIIGVDNVSEDATADVYKAVGIPYYTESRKSCGYARQCGVQNAKGKYHINIDSDTLYPPRYVETMIKNLQRKNVVAVCSSWGYFSSEFKSGIDFKLYELFRDVYLWLQSFKRPERSVRGIVFAYDTELARKIGFRTHIKRGEDGSLAFGLKQYGKIRFVHSFKARAITKFDREGSLMRCFMTRAVKYITGIKTLFTKRTELTDEESNIIK